MTYKETNTMGNFEYNKNDAGDFEFGRFFSPSEIGKYSNKIKSICDAVMNSKGIVLIYSQYIDGGLVPMALALEELGFRRHGKMNSLFKDAPTESIDATTFKKKSEP